MFQRKLKLHFGVNRKVYESALLTFKGVDGYDVYNCSVPFKYKGKTHLYGRVEKREEWANSHVRLFVETGKDEFTALKTFHLQLEDPFIARINDEMVFGGTHVDKTNGKVSNYSSHFYRGTPENLSFFLKGPDNMKDVRLVQLTDKRVAVFSRPRTCDYCSVGFTIIQSMEELTSDSILHAKPLNLFEEKTWGGVNQAYLLSSGKIGCIAHFSFVDRTCDKNELSVYVNCSFILDPLTLELDQPKVIGTRSCYPACSSKKPFLHDCAFTSGIVMREDGKCDLYSGLGDTCQGRITIDYPFEGHGDIVGNLEFSPHETGSIHSKL